MDAVTNTIHYTIIARTCRFPHNNDIRSSQHTLFDDFKKKLRKFVVPLFKDNSCGHVYFRVTNPLKSYLFINFYQNVRKIYQNLKL